MYNSKAIANYFLTKSFETGRELSPMKLIKLVYLAHGWNLGLNNKPLIADSIQAWKYGPVIKSLYQEFKNYGNGTITGLATDFEAVPQVPDDSTEIPLLNKIWEAYSPLSAGQLSSLTHEQGSPWDQTWNDNGGKHEMGTIIPNDLIGAFYRGKAHVQR
jgi:uncharacterized phage-associated protein